VPDLDLYTQHGAFLVAYESTEAALGPVTTEIYAPLSTQGTYDYSLAYNWKPSDFAQRNETARREVQVQRLHIILAFSPSFSLPLSLPLFPFAL